MNNYTLYTISHCPHCNEALELLNNYAADTGISYDVVQAKVEITRVPENEGLVKKAFVLYDKDKKNRYELPAVPALWIKDRNELVLGTGAVDYLKKLGETQ